VSKLLMNKLLLAANAAVSFVNRNNPSKLFSLH